MAGGVTVARQLDVDSLASGLAYFWPLAAEFMKY